MQPLTRQSEPQKRYEEVQKTALYSTYSQAATMFLNLVGGCLLGQAARQCDPSRYSVGLIAAGIAIELLAVAVFGGTLFANVMKVDRAREIALEHKDSMV